MLTVIRTKEGKSRWLTTSSTYFKDRDKEIVSEKALVADVERADADGDYGPLRWWHVKGLDIGTCDFNEVRDGMLIESGTFNNEAIARAVEKEARNLGVSIGFTHPADQPDAQGVFHDIRRYERSLLPLGSASNPYTTFSVKEKGMAPNTPERAAKKWRAFVDTVFQGDEDSAKAYAEQISARAEEIKSSGVAFKETRTEKGDNLVKNLRDLSASVNQLFNGMSRWTDDDGLMPVAGLVTRGSRNLMDAASAFGQAANALSETQTARRAGINKEADEQTEKAEAWDDMKYREPALASVRNALEQAREVQAAIVGFHGIVNPNDYRNMSKASWDKAVAALNAIEQASTHAVKLASSLESAKNSIADIKLPAAKKEARPTRVADRDPLASLFAGEGAKEVEVVETEKGPPQPTDLNQLSMPINLQKQAFDSIYRAGANGDWDKAKTAAQLGEKAAATAVTLWGKVAGEARAMVEMDKARGEPPQPTDLNELKTPVDQQLNIFRALSGAGGVGNWDGAVRLATEGKGWAQKAQRLFSRVGQEADAMG